MLQTLSDTCNGCDGSLVPWLFMPIDAKKNAPTPHSQVLRCKDCGLGVLSPLPDAEAIPAFYELDVYYTHGESHMRDKPSDLLGKVLTSLAWQADRSRPFDVHAIANTLPPDARICDLGCGHGHYLREFSELGFEVVGVEPDKAARESSGLNVLDGTAEDIPEGLGQFDFVIMTHALEHCRDPRKALENASSLTKPGGRCYIEVPNCACEHFQTFTVCSEMFDAPRHIYFFTPNNLQSLAEQVGFSVSDRLFSGYVRHFAPGWRAWEKEIGARIRSFGYFTVRPKVHSLAASAWLLTKSFWRSPERKYDCVGLMLERS